MHGASKQRILVITLVEDLLNARRSEPRCSLGQVCWAEHVGDGKQVARFHRTRRMRADPLEPPVRLTVHRHWCRTRKSRLRSACTFLRSPADI